MFAHRFTQLIVIILFFQFFSTMIILIRCDDDDDDDIASYNITIMPISATTTTMISDANVQHRKQYQMSNISTLIKQASSLSPSTIKMPIIDTKIDSMLINNATAIKINANSLPLVLSKKPIIQMAEYPGDIMIGAVFPIHQPESGNHSCGSLQIEGIQQLEAMIYVLDRINNDPNILPGIRLGALAIDSCESPHYAMEQIIDFIKSFVARSNRRQLQPEFHCLDYSAPLYKMGKLDKIVGIIGGQSSEVSLQLANLLRLFHIPQVSYLSTSPTLSDELLYRYFFRTVPSDINQVDAIVDILRRFNWTYVSVVYSDTVYGNNGYDLLTTAAARYNICISSPQAINVERFRLVDYDNLITTLMNKINARVVIVYTDIHVARKIMKAAMRRLSQMNRLDRFIWIASDAWCCRDFIVHGVEPVVEGTISVTPLHYPLNGFADYIRQLRPIESHHRLNPWFKEFWEKYFKCRLVNSNNQQQDYSNGIGPLNQISNDERLIIVNTSMPTTVISTDLDFDSKESADFVFCNRSFVIDNLQQSPSLHFVRDAFYSFAMTLNQIQKTFCGAKNGICDQMKEAIYNGQYVIEQMKKVEFRDEGGRLFKFQSNGDAPPRYTVVNFQQLSDGSFHWQPVGNYMIGENENKAQLKLDFDLLKFKHSLHRFPESFCSEPCQEGQAKLQLESDTCCWLCTNCSRYQYLVDEFHCVECPLGTLPNRNKTYCYPVPTMYLSLTEWWTLSSIAFATLGMIATAGAWLVFYYYSETPIIKASGRELSNLHLTGIFLSFAVTFVIISKPSPLTCGMTRFCLGFCYTICYSAIVTKTNRISRIFQHRSCKKPRFTSPRSQLIITTLLIFVEVFINIVWFFYTPPNIKLVYSSRENALLICSGSDHITYLFGLIYPLVLIGFCTVYAFKTRKCPEGFNEARYITFTNYTTCVVWFAFLPLYVMLSTTTPLRAITLSSLLSVSGAVQLFCLFVPKIYIALLKPEKNTRETVMCGGTLHRSLMFTQNMSRHYHHNYHRPKDQSKPSTNSNTATSTTDNSHKNPSGTTTTSAILEPISTSSEAETLPTGTLLFKAQVNDNKVISVQDKQFLDDGKIKNAGDIDIDEEHQLQGTTCDESMTHFLWDTNKNKFPAATNDNNMVDHSQMQKCLTSSSSANTIKHETKAVLENGHQHWPSIKLDTNSNIIKPI